MKTVLYEWHVSAGAKMHEFGGFEMPIQYETIFTEHLATRRNAGLFDISHMGRFFLSGKEAVPFLQHTLTNNALALDRVGMAQYTLIPDPQGGALDDAYLYRTDLDEYMLVVNAANRQKDWEWLTQFQAKFPNLALADRSDELAMIALQGPSSAHLLTEILSKGANAGKLPEPFRNELSFVSIDNSEVIISRTGYTGEPVGFEIFAPASKTVALWEQILETGEKYGALPVGLGARDTLRLEAGLPLYGHELGMDPEGNPIPIFALLSLANLSVSFSSAKGNFVGEEALRQQQQEVRQRVRLGGRFDPPPTERLVPRFIRRVAILNPDRTAPGINPVRQGHQVSLDGAHVGWITSGTTVPFHLFAGSGLYSTPEDEQNRRAIALAYLDADIVAGKKDQFLDVEKAKNRSVSALIVTSNMRATPPYSRAVTYPEASRETRGLSPGSRMENLVEELIERAVENSEYRQTRAVNLIPSEQTPSLFVRLLSSLDPVGRYAEHKQIKAFGKAAEDVFYYQGTEFIGWVEERLQAAMKEFLGCAEVEVRTISGQMANKAVFSGLVDYLNRFGKGEPERIGPVMNNHLGKGGHLSAQHLGALRHFVKRDPETDRPAVINFPVQEDNPYRIDVDATRELIDRHRPQLIAFGKSMVLHPEPIEEIAAFVADWKERPVIMYDMAHVLGLVGPHFQAPFAQGADIVTGSTHKTFFGPQRGIAASNMSEGAFYRPLWEKIVDEAFPGAVSNHHLGTLLGLLGATYEMLAFKDDYQQQVLANARAFARALVDGGLSVEGDPTIDYTETHQVILDVGSGKGPEVARRLEENRLITNYQALPGDTSFSDASGIRLGVQEMTRFGMGEEDFGELAGYMADVVLREQDCAEQVSAFRKRFTTMIYCLPQQKTEALTAKLLDMFGSLA